MDDANPDRAARWMALVIGRAADLRAAGILAIGCDGFTAQLAPAAPKPVELPKVTGQHTEEPSSPSALDDEASYAGGMKPGFTIGKLEELPDHYR